MAISVRGCLESEALSILRDPSVSQYLSIDPRGIASDWIMLLMGNRLLVLARPEDGELEIHVACRFRDRKNLKEVMVFGLDWLNAWGYKKIWTTAPEERKALVKMLESLGFRKVEERWQHGY